MKRIRTNISIDPDVKKQASKHASQTGRSLSGLIEWVLKQYLNGKK